MNLYKKKKNKLFVIGNGSDNDRHDAFIITRNGDAFVDNSLTIGKYPIINDNDTNIFVIGNGTSESANNALYVDANGNVHITGKLYVNTIESETTK